MKPVQILVDEDLLAEFDGDEQVQASGRSKVLRGLVTNYLQERRERAVDAKYAAGYGDSCGVSDDLAGWDEEGEWPDK